MAAPEVYHLTNVHSPFDVRIFYKQAQTLARAGYAVTVVGPGPEAWCGERAGVRVQTVPVARGVGQRILNLWRLLRVGLGADAACFHFHDPELLPVGAVLKLCGRRVIYDVHEHFPAGGDGAAVGARAAAAAPVAVGRLGGTCARPLFYYGCGRSG